MIKDGKSSNPNAIWYRPDISKTPSGVNDIEAYKPKKDLKPSPGLSPAPWLQQPAPGISGPAKKSNFQALGFIAAAEAEVELTPDTSDVPPIYMAIVSPDDPQAVMELISLIPAGLDTTEPTTFKRRQGKWEKDDSILNDLNHKFTF